MTTNTKVRRRSLVLGQGNASWFTTSGSGVRGPIGTSDILVRGTQITESEGHPFSYSFKGRDDGGPFRTQIVSLDGADPRPEKVGSVDLASYHLTSRKSATGAFETYNGPLPAIAPGSIDQSLSLIPDMSSSDAELIVLGTTAIALCKPGQPVVDLAVGFAELFREGLPHMVGSSLWQSRAKELGPPPKRGSDEYLNWVFGWKPLLADIMGAAKALGNQDRLLSQYERDSGRIVRRRYDFPTERNMTTDSVVSPRGPGFPTGAAKILYFKVGSSSVAQGTLTQTTTVEKERWFSGAFTYYLPAGYYSRNKLIRAAAKAKTLYGIELTPEVVWNLIPWSWAADWVANTGDVLSNVSDFALDGLVMHYGYMMETTTVTRKWVLSSHQCLGVPDPLITTGQKVFQRRIKASPFGFGLTWDDFSPRQLGILAALGISRSL